MSKTIGINALFLIPNQVGGTEYHLRSFVKYLQQVDTENEYVLFCNQENSQTFSVTNPRWRLVSCPVRAQNKLARILYEQVSLPSLVKKMNCQILHSFGYFGPLFGAFKKITTIHDTNWLDHPEDSSLIQNIILGTLISASLHKSDAIVTDSPFSLSRLEHYFPAESGKFKVIVPGIEDEFLTRLHHATDQAAISEPYLLCVSAFYPHKRIGYLLDLWSKLQSNKYPFKLVIIGHTGSEFSKLESRLRHTKNLIWLPKISFAQLINLYQHAQAFLFPSLYEGFGYPVYESLAAGLPTLVGKKELYLPEVQSLLEEFTFDETRDISVIQKLVLHQRTVSHIKNLDYEVAAQKLVKLYEST